jgi:hypothetical protein
MGQPPYNTMTVAKRFIHSNTYSSMITEDDGVIVKEITFMVRLAKESVT